LLCGAFRLKNPLRMSEQNFPSFGQTNPARQTVDELRAKVLLQVPQLLGDGRLADTKLACGTRQAAVLGNTCKNA
jgi:hypothetical protein